MPLNPNASTPTPDQAIGLDPSGLSAGVARLLRPRGYFEKVPWLDSSSTGIKREHMLSGSVFTP